MITDKWSEYWKNDSESGECFVSSAGKKNPELKTFWQNQICSDVNEKVVLDLASGAGSIFSCLDNTTNLHLYSSDLSFEALKKQSERNLNTHLVVSSADCSTFSSSTFDIVVSQFGIEYAQRKSFSVANELLKPGGKLVCLCHIKDGYIDKRNVLESEGIKLALNTHFIEIAIELTKSLFSGNETNIQSVLKDFQKIEPKMSERASLVKEGFQYHLYQGFRKMMESIKNYRCSDIVNWLIDMRNEMNNIESRLETMMRAALSRKDVAEIAQVLIVSGSCKIDVQPFFVSSIEKPIAWKLVSVKES